MAEPENAELLALIDEHFREFKEGSIVNGTILDIRPQVVVVDIGYKSCLLYTSPSPRDRQKSRMPSSA